jgi:hypothetical protein
MRSFHLEEVAVILLHTVSMTHIYRCAVSISRINTKDKK